MQIREISNQHIRIAVSELGAEMQSLFSLETETEWLWQGNTEIWPRKAPFLFPVVGKLNNNQFRHQGKILPLAQHGFARDSVFQLVAENQTMLRFRLEGNEEDFGNFPFPFILEIAYELRDSRILISCLVKNPSQQELPFSIGAHPGFGLSGWPDKNYYLHFPEAIRPEYSLLSNGLLDVNRRFPLLLENQSLKISPGLFAEDALIFAQPEFSRIQIVPEGGGEKLEVSFEGFPFLGLWSKPGAAFVCIEPWYGHADPLDFQGEFSEKPGIICLAAGGKFQCSFSLALLP